MSKVIYNKMERLKRLVKIALVPALIICLIGDGLKILYNIDTDFNQLQRLYIICAFAAMAVYSFGFGWAAGEEHTVDTLKLKEEP